MAAAAQPQPKDAKAEAEAEAEAERLATALCAALTGDAPTCGFRVDFAASLLAVEAADAKADADAVEDVLMRSAALPERPLVRPLARQLLRWAATGECPLAAAAVPRELDALQKREPAQRLRALGGDVLAYVKRALDAATSGEAATAAAQLFQALQPRGVLFLLGARGPRECAHCCS
jgi:hypothetical protein